MHDKIIGGSVAEWLKAHDSKSCGLQSLGGSNPLASAKYEQDEYPLANAKAFATRPKGRTLPWREPNSLSYYVILKGGARGKKQM